MRTSSFIGATLAVLSLHSHATPIRAAQSATANSVVSAARGVEFVLKGPNGQALGAGTRVHLFNAYGDVTVAPGGFELGAGGTARITGLPLGRYDFWIEPRADVAGQMFRGLEVQPGAGPQRFDLAVEARTALQGRLMRPDKTPAAGYIVAVQSSTWTSAASRNAARGTLAAYARGVQESYAQTTASADGTWNLAGLATGTYRLDVRKPGQNAPLFTIAGALAAAGGNNDVGEIIVPQNGWDWLFDGQLRHSGKTSTYRDSGEMKIETDRLILGTGQPFTGVTWTENLPRLNYEISLDAQRAAGQDFFCGLTFPVGDAPLSFIVGGWGGTIVGLSSINGDSAEGNETTQTKTFETGRWYRLRVRVTRSKIEAWIDNEKKIDLPTEGKMFSIRSTVEPSRPLGIATWKTTGWLRDIRLRRLDELEIADIEKAAAAQKIF